MPIQNMDVADIFNKYANLLEIEDANPFRVRSYRNAARVVSGLPRNLTDMVKKKEDLTKLSGIGKDLAKKIEEIVETGELAALKKMERNRSAGLHDVLKVSSLGPKRVKTLNRELGVSDLATLKKAAKMGKIRTIKGFGPKTEQRILDDVKRKGRQQVRIRWLEAEQRATALVDYLKRTQGIIEITPAGSYRRRKETVGDLDIVVTCRRNVPVMDRFVAYEDVDKVIAKGDTRCTAILRSGLQVDLRVVPRISYGAALHYFTGSKGHTIAVRKLAIKKGYKINEYGVFKDAQRIAGRTEKEVYDSVGLAYIEPELREEQGEIEAAREKRLPTLVTRKNLRGDLHIHTRETDGHHSLEEMAAAAQALGYEYLAVTEHSRRVTMANGLDERRLADRIGTIDRLNEKLEGLLLLKGIEVDILEDGSLDLPNDILKELDLTVCSVHYHQNLSKEKQTERILRAMDNPHFNILGHPTGRLINERPPYEVDLERLMDATVERGCFMEINANPDRLDLADRFCKMAKDKNLKLAVSTDAHSTTDLDFIRFGVDQARRGWLAADDVLNTRPWEELKKMLVR